MVTPLALASRSPAALCFHLAMTCYCVYRRGADFYLLDSAGARVRLDPDAVVVLRHLELTSWPNMYSLSFGCYAESYKERFQIFDLLGMVEIDRKCLCAVQSWLGSLGIT